MRPVPISPNFFLKKKTASVNFNFLMGIDHFRPYVKIALSLYFSFPGDAAQMLMEYEKNLIKQVFGYFMTSRGLHVNI